LRASAAGGCVLELTTPSLTPEPGALPADLRYPVQLQWRGWVRPRRTEPEPYRLVSTGSVAPTLRIGDVTADLNSPRELQPWRSAAPLQATPNRGSPSDTVRGT